MPQITFHLQFINNVWQKDFRITIYLYTCSYLQQIRKPMLRWHAMVSHQDRYNDLDEQDSLFSGLEVLQPSVPIRVMLGMISLPNHTFFLGRLSSKRLTSTFAHSFTRNWQVPFSNQRKGENDRRKYFMINLHERMLPDLVGIKSTTSWSPVRQASYRTIKADASQIPQPNVSYRNIHPLLLELYIHTSQACGNTMPNSSHFLQDT